jgi:hypothetical protein
MERMNRPINMSRFIFWGCFIVLWLPMQALADGRLSWVRGVVRAAKFNSGKDAHETFQLQVIRSEKGRSLMGMAILTRGIAESHPNHSMLEIEGVERDGRFWPFVRGEVSDDLDNGWQKVELDKPSGQLAVRRVAPQTLGCAVFIDLTAFAPYVGRKHFGRLLLPNGEDATFFLQNLTQPKESPQNWSRARMGTSEELHPTTYEATFLAPPKEDGPGTNLILMSVDGENGHVTGYFAHVSANSPTKKEEVKACDAPVSLVATLQVAEDYHDEWKTIGQSSRRGEGVEMNTPPPTTPSVVIELERFRPLIGNYRYGKVVLPSGDSAIIQLFDLLPPEKELIAKEHPDWEQY